MENKNSAPLGLAKIYFDGLCPLCSKEIIHYQKLPGAERLQFIDICAPDFDPALESLDPFAVHRRFHVRDQFGQIQTGIAGFQVIWRELPRYHWLAKISAWPGIRSVFALGYEIFAKLRPLLPRKKAGCENSKYCEVK